MATVTQGYTWTSGETVTPTKLNSAAAPTVVVADNEVTTSKIAAAAVTADKLASGSVTSEKLASGAAIAAGAVMSFAMNSVPSGWLACNGAAVSRSTYSSLFSAISTTYGSGDGSTTFNVPDLRGYFVRGSGTNDDGTVAGTFGAKQADELKGHTHTVYTKFVASLPAGGTAVLSDSNGSAQQTTPNTGSTGGTETRPKNIPMLYCIKF
jgi:microcystin-dependent protein